MLRLVILAAVLLATGTALAQFGSNASALRGQKLCNPLGPPTAGQTIVWDNVNRCWAPSTASGVATAITHDSWTLGAGRSIVTASLSTTSGNSILAIVPGTGGSPSLSLYGDSDITRANSSVFTLQLFGDTLFAQSQKFGTGTAVTTHNFGEFAGTSDLTSWNIQFAGITKFQVTPTTMQVPITPAVTGQRYVCIDTTGHLISQTTACVGT